MNKETYKYEPLNTMNEQEITHIQKMDMFLAKENMHIMQETLLNMGIICDIFIDIHGFINFNKTQINIFKLIKTFEIAYDKIHSFNYYINYDKCYYRHYPHYKYTRNTFITDVKLCIKIAKSNEELIQKLNKIKSVFYRWGIIDHYDDPRPGAIYFGTGW